MLAGAIMSLSIGHSFVSRPTIAISLPRACSQSHPLIRISHSLCGLSRGRNFTILAFSLTTLLETSIRSSSRIGRPSCGSLDRSGGQKTSWDEVANSYLSQEKEKDARTSKSAGQCGRSLTTGAFLSTNWTRDIESSRACVWWTTRKCSLDSSGRSGPQQRFSQGRFELGVMAASAEAPEGYRRNVGLCLVNEKNEVFVASRLDIADSWQMPQGGVDDGEDPRNAAIRELREETGVTSMQLIGEVPEWLTYDFPADVKSKLTRLWGTEWKGQAQKWFLFRFTGDESEITLLGDGSEKPEFGDWKWLRAEDVLKLAVDFKKPVYVQAFKALAVYIDSWSTL